MQWPDYLIIFIYVGASLAVGLAFRGKQDTTADYFTADGGMKGLLGSILVGTSLAATLFSGISFMAYPSVVYSSGTAILLALIIFPLCWVVLRYWFLPRYLALPITQPYDVIERRFSPAARTTAAIMFLLLRTGWMAALIYAPTIAILAAAQLGPGWFWPVVLIIGLVSTFYTALGGIRGVIITDSIQFFVIAIGILFTIVYVLCYLPTSVPDAISGLDKSGAFNTLDFSFDPTNNWTVWAVLIGAFVNNCASYIGDQMSLQRYLATGDTKTVSRSFTINVIGVIVVLLMLGGVGLAMRAWYAASFDPTLPTRADRVFPHFIATQLPVGIRGLLLAAILAATMSSMTSGINAMSAVITLDLRTRFGKAKKWSPSKQVRFSKWVSVAVGLAATLMAGAVSHLGDIFDIAQTLLGVFLGPLLGVVILSLIPLRLRSGAMIAGMILGAIVGWAATFTSIASLWIGPISLVVTCLVAVLLSWIRIIPVELKNEESCNKL